MMRKVQWQRAAVAVAAMIGVALLAGCETMGWTAPSHGGIGGPALGAAGGYVVGVEHGNNDEAHRDAVVHASQEAETDPARADDVRKSPTADLNGDGYVTLDEVVAMHDAGLMEAEQVARLRATGMTFGVTNWQEQYLRDRGVSRDVVDAMREAGNQKPE